MSEKITSVGFGAEEVDSAQPLTVEIDCVNPPSEEQLAKIRTFMEDR